MLDTISKYKTTKLKNFKKVEFADQDIVEKFVPQLAEILDLVDLDIEECLVTDESMYCDFEGLVANNKNFQSLKKYDIIISNPPYYRNAKNMGIEDEKRALARHDKDLPFEDLCIEAYRLMKEEALFWLILP